MSREQLVRGLQAMLPNIMDTHMLDLLEPMWEGIGYSKKRQIARDKAASRLSKEVIALRITGQAKRDQVAQLTTQITKLTPKLEDVLVSQMASAAQSPISATHGAPNEVYLLARRGTAGIRRRSRRARRRQACRL